MRKISLFLLILLCVSDLFAYSVVMLGYSGDGPVERGFRDGIISELPEVRFYTFGCAGDLELFRKQLKASKEFGADLYFTNGQVPTKELLKDKTLPPAVFVSIQYPFQDELFEGVDFTGSAGIKTTIPIEKLLTAMKKVVDFKRLGVLQTDNNRNYEYSIKEIKKLSGELGFQVVEFASNDLFRMNADLAADRPDALYIPAHGKMDNNMFNIIKAHNIPTIAEDTEDVRHRGALLALVVDRYRAGRLAAKKAVEILSAGKLPKQPVTSIEHFLFVVNLMTAARLGVHIPMQYLIIADQIVR